MTVSAFDGLKFIILKLLDFFKFYWSAFRVRIRRYLTVLRWFLVDSLGPVKIKAVGVVAIGFLGVSLQVGAIGLCIKYAKHLSSGKNLSIFNFVFHPRESLLLLVVFSALFLVLSVISSWMIYLGNKFTFHLAFNYEKSFLIKVYRSVIVDQNIIPTPVSSAETPEQSIVKLVCGDVRIITRVIKVVLSAIVPFLTFICATIILFYSNFILSLLLMVVVFMSAVFYLKVNFESLEDSKKMERTVTPLASMKRSLIRCFSGASVLPGSYVNDFAGTLLSDDLYIDNMEGFRGRIMARDKSRLVSEHLGAICIVLIFLVIGYQMLISHEGWGRLVIYLLALKYCLANFQKVTGMVTTVNRFYPVISRMYDFSVQADSNSPRDYKSCSLDVISSSKPTIVNSEAVYRPVRGGVIRVLTAMQINRFSLPSFFSIVFNGGRKKARILSEISWFYYGDGMFPPLSISQYLGFPDEEGVVKYLNCHVPDDKVVQVVEQLGIGKGGALIDESLSNAAIETKCIIVLLAALNSGREIVVFGESLISGLDNDLCQNLLSKFEDRYIFIVGDSLSNIDIFKWDKIVILNESSVGGIGDISWVKENSVKITSLLASMKNDSVIHATDDDDELDVDLL